MAQISEYSEAGITVRGQYYAPGKAPKDDDRKLYLAIESTSELAVQKARVQQWLFPLVSYKNKVLLCGVGKYLEAFVAYWFEEKDLKS